MAATVVQLMVVMVVQLTVVTVVAQETEAVLLEGQAVRVEVPRL
jgi:hypothetical protein